MRFSLVVLTVVIAGSIIGLRGASHGSDAETKAINNVATHQQVDVVEMDDADNPLKMNAFCLDSNGRIVVACGAGPGEIRVIDDKGEILRSWTIALKPEAVSVADDGTVLVGGEGKLFRFNAEGKLLNEADSPHAERLRSNTEKLRELAIEYLNRNARPMRSRVTTYESMLKQLEARAEKGELNSQEERTMEVISRMLEQSREQADEESKEAEGKAEKGPSESAIQEQIDRLTISKMRVSSVSSGGDHVFVATSALEGYGYEVWKMESDFTDAKVIVSDLRGCCGQMDVQCCENGLYVAENARHRVVNYNIDGEEVTNWGKTDRSGLDGFTSCCNPMNVCFNSRGDVFTAESSTGRIKHFNRDGELLAYIGAVDLVPGCKNVSIAVSSVNDKVYMLDLTRNHIVIMQPTAEETGHDQPAENALPQNAERQLEPSRDSDKTVEVEVNRQPLVLNYSFQRGVLQRVKAARQRNAFNDEVVTSGTGGDE